MSRTRGRRLPTWGVLLIVGACGLAGLVVGLTLPVEGLFGRVGAFAADLAADARAQVVVFLSDTAGATSTSGPMPLDSFGAMIGVVGFGLVMASVLRTMRAHR